MAYGVQFFSQNGDIQIDSLSSSLNYRILTSGSGFGDTNISHAVQSQVPLVFVRAGYGVPFTITNQSTSGFSIAISDSFSYVVLVPTTGASSSTHGLRVWNDSGTLVYDSGFQNSMIDFFQYTSAPFPKTFTLPTPSVGIRYVLANPMTIIKVFSTEVDIAVWQYEYTHLNARLDSETSVTLLTSTSFSYFNQSPLDFDNNGSIPFTAAYINL